MNFELTTIDPNNCTLEELEKEIQRLTDLKDEYYGLEQSLKIYINSIYGALASVFFVGYNVNCAEAVTLQGQDIIKFTNKIINDYFNNEWHLDKELHEKLGLTIVNKIPSTISVCVYNDTDSLAGDSIINTNKEIITIEEWYNKNIQKGSNGITIYGHESVKTDDKILNWSNNKNLYYANVKRIIRHKVSKSKWKIKTKSGKTILITNDHSIIVFRNNKQLEISPENIKKGDKVICIK